MATSNEGFPARMPWCFFSCTYKADLKTFALLIHSSLREAFWQFFFPFMCQDTFTHASLSLSLSLSLPLSPHFVIALPPPKKLART